MLILLGTSLPNVLSYSEPRFHDGLNRPIDLQVEESEGRVQVISDRDSLPNVNVKHKPENYEKAGAQGN